MNAYFPIRPMTGSSAGTRSGFTLLELLVSVVILGIVVATVAPAVGRSMSQTRVQRAASVLATDIQRAFSMAAQRRSPVRISVDTAGKIFYIRNVARDTTYLQANYTSASEIGLTRLQASDTTILIYPNGLASGGITITAHTAGANRRQVAATRAGQIRITTP